MNSKLIQMLHSRTFGTLLVMVAYNVVSALMPQTVNDPLFVMVNGILGAIAVYFHVNPSQFYTSAGVTPPPLNTPPPTPNTPTA